MLTIAILLLTSSASGADRRVCTGCTYETIQEAVDACQPGDRILLLQDQGNVGEVFIDQYDITFDGNGYAVLDGWLRFTRGNENDDALVTNTVFVDSTVGSGSVGAGGLQGDSPYCMSSVEIDSCLFHGSYLAPLDGDMVPLAAIQLHTNAARILHTTVQYVSSPLGACWLAPKDCDGDGNEADFTVAWCTIQHNEASGPGWPWWFKGSGLTIAATDPFTPFDFDDPWEVHTLVQDSVIADNSGAPGIHLENMEVDPSLTSMVVLNCTLVNNSAPHWHEAGGVSVALPEPGIATVLNSILWWNTVGGSAGFSSQSNLAGSNLSAFSFCSIEAKPPWKGTGNSGDIPMFVDSASGDYHQIPGSPCIDAASMIAYGDHALLDDGSAVDLDGQPRDEDVAYAVNQVTIQHGAVDMGAYEQQGVTWPKGILWIWGRGTLDEPWHQYTWYDPQFWGGGGYPTAERRAVLDDRFHGSASTGGGTLVLPAGVAQVDSIDVGLGIFRVRGASDGSSTGLIVGGAIRAGTRDTGETFQISPEGNVFNPGVPDECGESMLQISPGYGVAEPLDLRAPELRGGAWGALTISRADITGDVVVDRGGRVALTDVTMDGGLNNEGRLLVTAPLSLDGAFTPDHGYAQDNASLLVLGLTDAQIGADAPYIDSGNGPLSLAGGLILIEYLDAELPVGAAFNLLSATEWDGTRFDAVCSRGFEDDRFVALTWNETSGASGSGLSLDGLVMDIDEVLYGGGEAGSASGEAGDSVLADFDSDGDLDLALSVPAADLVVVFENTGTSGARGGSYAQFEVLAQIDVGDAPRGIDAGDMDGDGDWDVAVACSGDDTLWLLTNQMAETGSVSFLTDSVDIQADVHPDQTMPWDVVIGEFDDVAGVDLVVSCAEADCLVLVQVVGALDGGLGGQEAGNPIDVPDEPGPLDPIGTGDKPRGVAGVGREQAFSVKFGVALTSTATVTSQSLIGSPQGLTVADMDGDGVEDVIVTMPGALAIAVLPGTATGIDEAANVTLTGAPAAVASGNIDGSGEADLYVVYEDAATGEGQVRPIRNLTSDPSMIQLVEDPDVIMSGVSTATIVAGDLDGDGADDALGFAATASLRGGEEVWALNVVDVDGSSTGSPDPGDPGSLQMAIDSAADGDVIDLLPGTYTRGSGDWLALIEEKSLTIRGATGLDGEMLSVLDAQNGQALRVTPGYGQAVTLERLLIQNGQASVGAGLYCSNAEGQGGGFVNLSQVKIDDCTATDHGGGIALFGGTVLYMSDVVIDGCSSSDRGGGLYAKGDVVVTATDCTINNCSGGYGGAIYAREEAQLTMSDCSIESCNASSLGGGVRLWSECTLTMTDCFITQCSAASGGALAIKNASNVNMTGGLISSCSAANLGGSLAMEQGSGGVFTAVSISASSCTPAVGGDQGSGGAAFLDASHPTFDQCSIWACEATGNGGGLYCWNAQPIIQGCNLWNNTAGAGGAIRSIGGSGPTVSASMVCSNSGEQMVGAWVDGGDNCIMDACNADSDGDGVLDCDDSNPDGPNPGVPGSLQLAIDAAADGAIIQLVSGYYLPPEGAAHVIDTDKVVTIVGSVTQNGAPNSWFYSEDAPSLGPAARLSGGGHLTLENVAMAGFGQGGIRVLQSSLSLDNCLIYGCGGFGVKATQSTLTLTGVAIRANGGSDTGSTGGGLSLQGGSAHVTGGRIHENHATLGGGVYANAGAQVEFHDAHLYDNTCSVNGGGVCISDSSTSMAFTACRLWGNEADLSWGNAIAIASSAQVSLASSRVCHNGDSGSQIGGDWQDLGGNCIDDVCPDEDGDEIPDPCEDCLSDVNGDGFVNIDDLLFVLAGFGTAAGDVNGDGVGDIEDLLLVLSQFGGCS
ncbi:MAG: right-handed parallel beta-helix repeat-containing protein [Phycisphaerales bacterium]|nr:right-handed parallel beta-helix repeat-containing protein [Phycisphaerales bacterium]